MEDSRKILVTNFMSRIEELQRDCITIHDSAPGEEQRHWNASHNHLRLAKHYLQGMVGLLELTTVKPLEAVKKIVAAGEPEPVVISPSQQMQETKDLIKQLHDEAWQEFKGRIPEMLPNQAQPMRETKWQTLKKLLFQWNR